MNNRAILGAYVPVDSKLHHLDPRSKFLVCFLFVVDCFLVQTLAMGALSVLALLLAMLASRVRLKNYWAGLKPFLWIILITVAFQLLFSSGGHVFWSDGPMAVTTEGMINAVYITYRFVMTILAATVLTATTTAFQLSQALTWLLSPLKKLKFPVDQFALMMGISLQFIPILSNEYRRIKAAQVSRGADFNGGGWRHIRQLLPLLIPLLVSTFNRASELATAMEVRGYVPGKARSAYRQLHWRGPDSRFILLTVLLTVVINVVQFMI